MFTTIDICERLAEKLSHFAETHSHWQYDSLQQENEISLANGYPGLALLFSLLNQNYPHSNYASLSHTYLEKSISLLSNANFVSLSLLQGMTGICYVVNICSKEGSRYEKLRNELDKLFINKLDEYLFFNECGYHPHIYNFANGISGALPYLFLRRSDRLFARYLDRSLSKLISLMNCQQEILSCSLPGWYEPVDSIWNQEDKAKFPNGKFNPAFLTGISGILSALSIAAIEGINHEDLYETIITLANWIKGKQIQSQEGPAWASSVSFEEETGLFQSNEPILEKSPQFIMRSLFLAGKALQNKEIQIFAENSLVTRNERSFKNDLSLLTGKAGMLAVNYCMSQDTQNYIFFKKCRELEGELLHAFDPNLPFGFDFAEEKHGFGILTGAAGIALVLLLIQEPSHLSWDRMLLLR